MCGRDCVYSRFAKGARGQCCAARRGQQSRNAVFVGLRRFGKETGKKVVGVGGKPG